MKFDPFILQCLLTNPRELLTHGGPVQPPLDLGWRRPLEFALRRHRATREHLDFRIRIYDTLLSFCLPDPLLRPDTEMEALLMADHNPNYLKSEWVIPAGMPGAGPTMPVDMGMIVPLGEMEATYEREMLRQLAKGELRFLFQGKRLKGIWELTRLSKEWVFRMSQGQSETEKAPPSLDRSILTDRTLDEIIDDERRRK